MRGRVWTSTLLVACAVAALWMPIGAAGAPTSRDCGYVSFSGKADDNGVTVRALGISCPAARRAVRRWFGSGGFEPGRYGWRCRAVSKVGPFDKTRCSKGRKRITFVPAG